jgi:palmitoyltransferase
MYLVLSTFCFGVLGYQKLFETLGFSIHHPQWPHFVPEVVYAMIYILAVVLCFAVGVMLTWHLWGITKAETSVESQDNEQYRERAKARRETFVNSYDLG